MSTVEVVKQGDNEYSLSGNLNRDTVMECWKSRDSDLLALRGKANEIHIDLANIKNVDTAGLAWLVHLTKFCNVNKLELTIVNAPSSIINLAKLSNLESTLPLQ